MRARFAELDLIFKRIYEDNISGKLTDERFIKLSRAYELEQDNLRAKSKILREDATILGEFVDKILVSKTSGKCGRSVGEKVEELEIVYNFIGTFDFGKAIEQFHNKNEIAKVGIA